MNGHPSNSTPERPGTADGVQDIIRPHKPLVVPHRDGAPGLL